MWYETEGYQVFHWYDAIGVACARYQEELYRAIQKRKQTIYKVEDWQKRVSQEEQEEPEDQQPATWSDNEEDPGWEHEREYQDWLHSQDDTHDYEACDHDNCEHDHTGYALSKN